MKNIFTALSLLLVPVLSHAKLDAFSKVEDKAKEVLEFLTGPIMVTFIAIAVVVAGLMLAKGKGNAQLMWGIIFGSILIGSAAQVADWLIG